MKSDKIEKKNSKKYVERSSQKENEFYRCLFTSDLVQIRKHGGKKAARLSRKSNLPGPGIM